MRLGIASSLHHESPQQWALQLKNLGCKCAVFPLNCNDSKDKIKAYAECAKENDLVIAEVGIWNNMLDSDPEVRKINTDYNILALCDLSTSEAVLEIKTNNNDSDIYKEQFFYEAKLYM